MAIATELSKAELAYGRTGDQKMNGGEKRAPLYVPVKGQTCWRSLPASMLVDVLACIQLRRPQDAPLPEGTGYPKQCFACLRALREHKRQLGKWTSSIVQYCAVDD